MIIFCSACNINWASLWQQSVDDETYEFCPLCKSDMHLQDATDIISYTRCPFTGQIRNTVTRELINERPFAMREPERAKVFDETIEEYMKRKEQIEDATPLNVQVPKIERKHHFEFK